jgi:hypothetical protein
MVRAVGGFCWVVACASSVPKDAGVWREGFTNLTTGSDYNHLAKHVNANPFRLSRSNLLA